MTKRVKRPDGTEETVEGTPEEIAEYERALNEGRPATKRKPPILKGKELEELQQWIRENIAEVLRRIDALPPPIQITQYPSTFIQPPLPIWCIYCGTYGCNRSHIICDTKTWTAAGTSISLDGELVGSTLKLTS